MKDEGRRMKDETRNPLHYPAKIWLAFGETLKGNKDILDWLLKNGYRELAVLSSAVRGSEEATEWLMKNGFPHLAALDAAIDGDQNAYKWLHDNKHDFFIVFADACHANPAAIYWFRKNKLDALLNIALLIKKLRDSATYDYHKLHF
jgi:hypothetical protein